MNGTLYLIPCLLGDTQLSYSIPEYNIEIIKSLDLFIVEDIRTARRFLIKANIGKPIDSLTFFLLNEHSKPDTIIEPIESLLQGKNVGVLSDAGCPGIADPGSSIVREAHEKGIKVVPLVGPSSILLALISSGLNGQSFTFHGYLPKQPNDRIKKLKQLESEAMKTGTTQLFIEAPYRNDSLFKDILSTCNSNTFLCVASDLTLPSEFIETCTIGEWKKKKLVLNDRPTVFLIGK